MALKLYKIYQAILKEILSGRSGFGAKITQHDYWKSFYLSFPFCVHGHNTDGPKMVNENQKLAELWLLEDHVEVLPATVEIPKSSLLEMFS